MSNTTEHVGYFTLPIVFFAGAGTEHEAKRRRWIRSDGEADGVLRSRLESSLKFRARVVSMTSLVIHSLLLGSAFYYGFPRGAGPNGLKPLYRSYKTIRSPLPPHSRL